MVASPIIETLYYLRRAGMESGPFTLGQLRSMWQTGAVTADTLYRFDPVADWQPLTNLRKLLEQPPPAAPARPMSPARVAQGGEGLALPIVALVLSCLPIFCFGGLVCAHLAIARPRSATDAAPRVITIIALIVGYLMAIQSVVLLYTMAHIAVTERRMNREFEHMRSR